MKELIQNFNSQLKEAFIIAEKSTISTTSVGIKNIVVTGLGGSGIGGTIVSELITDFCHVPIIINKDYFLPAFVNESTLLIVSSYSGNTEETISAMQQGLSKKAQIVCITSGGKISELAKQHLTEFVEIPGGMPPRSCLGYSLVQLINVLCRKGFAKQLLFQNIIEAVALLENKNSEIKTEAKKIAEKLNNKIAVIYSFGTCESVTVRFRQQINENSKQLCWHHSFPEMNHNELVGWTSKNDNLVVISFHTSFDYDRTKKRYEVCKPIFQKHCSDVIEINAQGNTKLEQFLYLINIGDWISYYIADIKNIDPVEVKIIDYLKSELSKF
ncbi:MAG: bifunctional phosphoglucose/phosphomannose isomerase [Bacteroidetes bacterium]|nr:bifunctional phosphoglucose/phosphomannose isomerase [Bacteroidota bacterium]